MIKTQLALSPDLAVYGRTTKANQKPNHNNNNNNRLIRDNNRLSLPDMRQAPTCMQARNAAQRAGHWALSQTVLHGRRPNFCINSKIWIVRALESHYFVWLVSLSCASAACCTSSCSCLAECWTAKQKHLHMCPSPLSHAVSQFANCILHSTPAHYLSVLLYIYKQRDDVWPRDSFSTFVERKLLTFAS